MTKLSDIGHLYRSFMSSGKVEILDMNCLSFTDVLEMKQTVIE